MTTEYISTGIDELEDIFYICSPDGLLLEWNEQLPAISGYDEEELGSMKPMELFSDGDREAISELIETTTETRTRNTIPADLKTKGGTEIPYEISASPLETDDEIEAIMGVARDITDRLKNERRLQQLTTEIRELSMPVVEIWDGVIMTTVVGSLNTQRAEQLTQDLLTEIVETEAAVALVDITEVGVVDTATAQHLIDAINAINLIGAEVIITGISPDIAQTLVQLGINLDDIETQSSLINGFQAALQWQGLSLSRKSGSVLSHQIHIQDIH